MSLHIFSDESVTGDKSAENCDFLFSPPELTGRSSVLRLSQKENVPPKSTDKAVKEPRAAGLAPCDLGPGAPLLPVGPIVDVLQYSQKNLDSAVEATQKENEVLRGKCAALQERLLEMGKIMDSFEGTVYQVVLRKEQMCVHSLKKVVEQKTKENDELTRICDDLISKRKRI
ncbi:hypothetical protein MJG53_014270 [Ovis ammon polii x Ovis aries]|uniref:Uncharacterized protein n=1 Tax=Ovis ammon polii x Ovis aries TaxID=2918886 RepID=A0ACB9UG49_9CETA|nr:hypothetical protein MJG53_014270 [Ovis ammon polii x Ovis aries]